MNTAIRIVKKGEDHVELQVDDEAAADRVADEANKKNLGPVIGQRKGLEDTGKHYVVLHGVVDEIVTFLEKTPGFKIA